MQTVLIQHQVFPTTRAGLSVFLPLRVLLYYLHHRYIAAKFTLSSLPAAMVSLEVCVVP